jgi:hypothetical protein
MKKYVKAARAGREKEVYVVQEYTGYGRTGWEDVCTYDDTSSQSYKEAKDDVKSYRENGFSARVITRRVPNPDYVEPEHTITSEEVINYLKNDCPYPISGNERGYWSGCTVGSYPKWCQIFIMDDNTVGVYNCSSHRTKYVYNLEDMINAIDRIMK